MPALSTYFVASVAGIVVKESQVPINALIVQVEFQRGNFTGYATNRARCEI